MRQNEFFCLVLKGGTSGQLQRFLDLERKNSLHLVSYHHAGGMYTSTDSNLLSCYICRVLPICNYLFDLMFCLAQLVQK